MARQAMASATGQDQNPRSGRVHLPPEIRVYNQDAEPPTVFVLLLPGDRPADPEDTA